MGGHPVHIRAGLQRGGPGGERLLPVRGAAAEGGGRQHVRGAAPGGVAHEGLHPAGRLRRGRAPTPERGPPRGRVHGVPYHAHQDGPALVLQPEPAQGRGAQSRPHRLHPGEAERPQDATGGAQLDLHRDHGHDRMEHAAAAALPEALPAGPARGEPVPQLPAGGAHHAGGQLHPAELPPAGAHAPAPHVAGVGPRSGDVPRAAPQDSQRRPQRGLHPEPLLLRAPDRFRSVARARGRGEEAAGAAAHRAAGAAEPEPPLPRAGAAGAVLGYGRVGGGPRAERGHLPLRAQAPADHGARPPPDPCVHLDQDPRAGPELPGGPGEGHGAPLLHKIPGLGERPGGAPRHGGLRAGVHLRRAPQGAGGVRGERTAAGVHRPHPAGGGGGAEPAAAAVAVLRAGAALRRRL
mmetsp:Transcript_72383/g.228169  ORF Transcript_72383/g.228169 Transcript_72383/m.228169 type:complete len:407 (+) Transcript_72383:853-2073(+)